jgi:hypothetical protein
VHPETDFGRAAPHTAPRPLRCYRHVTAVSSASADKPRAQERLSERQNIDRVGIDRRGLVGEGVHALLTRI